MRSRLISYSLTGVLLATVGVAGGLLLPPTGHAQGGYTQDSVLDPFAYEAISVGATAVSFTEATHSPSGSPSAKRAVCTTETATIRYRYEGTPTTSEGHSAAAGSTLTVHGTNAIRTFRMIGSGGTATARCTYFR